MRMSACRPDEAPLREGPPGGAFGRFGCCHHRADESSQRYAGQCLRAISIERLQRLGDGVTSDGHPFELPFHLRYPRFLGEEVAGQVHRFGHRTRECQMGFEEAARCFQPAVPERLRDASRLVYPFRRRVSRCFERGNPSPLVGAELARKEIHL